MSLFWAIISKFTVFVTNLFSDKKGDITPTLQENAEVEKGGMGGNAKGVSGGLLWITVPTYCTAIFLTLVLFLKIIELLKLHRLL